jgi:CHAT domain-containing protein
VNDEATQKLMVSFYTNWIGGMDRHDAFRAAQSELRQAFDNPYYWGAFIMIGR